MPDCCMQHCAPVPAGRLGVRDPAGVLCPGDFLAYPCSLLRWLTVATGRT